MSLGFPISSHIARCHGLAPIRARIRVKGVGCNPPNGSWGDSLNCPALSWRARALRRGIFKLLMHGLQMNPYTEILRKRDFFLRRSIKANTIWVRRSIKMAKKNIKAPFRAGEYSYRAHYSPDEGTFMGLVDEFPGLSAFSDTLDGAIKEINTVVSEGLRLLAERGIQIPEPHSRHE